MIIMYKQLLLLFVGCISICYVVIDPTFGEFERGLSGHVIDSDNLTLKEPIGEGKYYGHKSC